MILFIIFLTLGIFSFALAPTILNNAVYSVLCFIAVFLLISGILLSVGVEFLAFVYAIVYIGAVAVLFLFVVMFLQVSNRYNTSIKTYWIILLFLGIINITFKVFKILTGTIAIPHYIFNFDILISESRMPVNLENIHSQNLWEPANELYLISHIFYNMFGMLFLETAFILLLALIAVIVLTKTVIKTII
jgi:NADH-quinone oxidoreductase subunit J